MSTITQIRVGTDLYRLRAEDFKSIIFSILLVVGVISVLTVVYLILRAFLERNETQSPSSNLDPGIGLTNPCNENSTWDTYTSRCICNENYKGIYCNTNRNDLEQLPQSQVTIYNSDNYKVLEVDKVYSINFVPTHVVNPNMYKAIYSLFPIDISDCISSTTDIQHIPLSWYDKTIFVMYY